MGKPQKPKPKTVQPVYQERTSPFIPEAISLHEEDQEVEEQQSYAMVTGLLQVLVDKQSPGNKRPLINVFIRHQGGQHCLSTVHYACCRLLPP